MAINTHSRTMSRRTVIAGAATLVAAPAVAAAPSIGDAAFAAKHELAWRAWRDVGAREDLNKMLLRDMGEKPSLPDSLLEPLHLQGTPEPAKPDRFGWTQKDLRTIVSHGSFYGVQAVDTEQGPAQYAVWWQVTPKARKRAADLLAICEAHDAVWNEWQDKVEPLEDLFAEAVQRADAVIRDLIAYPVFTLPEIKQKLAILETSRLLECVDEGGQVRKALLRDALAVAEKAVRNG